MADLIPEGKTRLLLLEGQDDHVFFEHLINHLETSADARLHISEYTIIQYGGRTKLTLLLRELKKAPNFEEVTHIGIVRDSDFNTDAFLSVQDRIKTVNDEGPPKIGIPDQPNLPTVSVPEVSVLIVPSAQREGMLDDLVVDAIKVDPISECVENYFKCLSEKDVVAVRERKTKASIRVFLIAKNLDRATEISGITDRLFLSDVYETRLWQESGLWDSKALSGVKAFLEQLLGD